MKKAMLIAVCLALNSGCAGDTPQTKYATALDVYIAQEQAVVDLRKAGKVNDGDYNSSLSLFHAERQALRAWKADIDAGRPADVSLLALQAARAALEQFLLAHGGNR